MRHVIIVVIAAGIFSVDDLDICTASIVFCVDLDSDRIQIGLDFLDAAAQTGWGFWPLVVAKVDLAIYVMGTVLLYVMGTVLLTH